MLAVSVLYTHQPNNRAIKMIKSVNELKVGGGVWRAYVDDFFAMESCTQNAIIYT